MISFELTAIDLILVLAVIVLLILYMKKIADPNEEYFGQLRQKVTKPQRAVSTPQHNNGKCPRGFGNIKGLDEGDSVSERCLGCYMIMECYSENNK